MLKVGASFFLPMGLVFKIGMGTAQNERFGAALEPILNSTDSESSEL
jgi:hypothetical protein